MEAPLGGSAKFDPPCSQAGHHGGLGPSSAVVLPCIEERSNMKTINKEPHIIFSAIIYNGLRTSAEFSRWQDLSDNTAPAKCVAAWADQRAWLTERIRGGHAEWHVSKT